MKMLPDDLPGPTATDAEIAAYLEVAFFKEPEKLDEVVWSSERDYTNREALQEMKQGTDVGKFMIECYRTGWAQMKDKANASL